RNPKSQIEPESNLRSRISELRCRNRPISKFFLVDASSYVVAVEAGISCSQSRGWLLYRPFAAFFSVGELMATFFDTPTAAPDLLPRAESAPPITRPHPQRGGKEGAPAEPGCRP